MAKGCDTKVPMVKAAKGKNPFAGKAPAGKK